jgi:hypothetical protein
MNQDILTPAVLQRCPEIPLPRRPVLDPVQNTHIVPPGQLKSAKNKIWSAGSERALDTLIEIANRMTHEGKGISFRPGLVSPPETHVIR